MGVFRVDPAMPFHAYKTFTIFAPFSTHWRKATCEEVECQAWLRGWQTSVDETTELGKAQAAYIRAKAGRRYSEAREGELTVFMFMPEQTCFRSDEHKVRLDREPRFLVWGGDHRGKTGRDNRQHSSFDAWANDFGEHQASLARAIGQ